MLRNLRILVLSVTVLGVTFAPSQAWTADLGTVILRAGAVGAVVQAAAPELDKFINTVTLKGNAPKGISTKVVPILSVGEKAYVGAAQVAGPGSSVKQVKAIWLYEDNFSQNEFRLKVLAPTASLNPLQFKRVRNVGISAVIDVALDGRWKGQTISRGIGLGDVLKVGVVAVAINAAAKPLNSAINSITGNSSANTKIVPIATIGDKAYIGGVQVTGAGSAVSTVKAVYQYENLFDNAKFRIKAFVPSKSSSPLKISRVQGFGITALIDTSIADQETVRERRRVWVAS